MKKTDPDTGLNKKYSNYYLKIIIIINFDTDTDGYTKSCIERKKMDPGRNLSDHVDQSPNLPDPTKNTGNRILSSCKLDPIPLKLQIRI